LNNINTVEEHALVSHIFNSIFLIGALPKSTSLIFDILLNHSALRPPQSSARFYFVHPIGI
jgi:hypothetical protein